ncbi:hypothetical protein C5167_008132 [Papaver somniferum]|uniref:Uncharacterized protein n=1 Tax=Papaver somniferum TaxID=3469 RepID=A0A4Y7JWT7_PAPSO|nr:hypothetical protein C5167_008132 [Papaver somniferum]
MECASLKDVPAAPDQLAPQALSLFAEGICHILSHWVSLMTSVSVLKRLPKFQISEYLTENRGKFMSEEVKQLADDILIWFAQSQDERKVKSLEYLIKQILRSKFNISVVDGSTLLVSSKLEMLHQDLVQGNFESVEELRNSSTSRIGQKTSPYLNITKQSKKSSIVKDMKRTSKRHARKHARKLQLLLSSLHISDC